MPFLLHHVDMCICAKCIASSPLSHECLASMPGSLEWRYEVQGWEYWGKKHAAEEAAQAAAEHYYHDLCQRGADIDRAAPST